LVLELTPHVLKRMVDREFEVKVIEKAIAEAYRSWSDAQRRSHRSGRSVSRSSPTDRFVSMKTGCSPEPR
jgi:hypothetical protein